MYELRCGALGAVVLVAWVAGSLFFSQPEDLVGIPPPPLTHCGDLGKLTQALSSGFSSVQWGLMPHRASGWSTESDSLFSALGLLLRSENPGLDRYSEMSI